MVAVVGALTGSQVGGGMVRVAAEVVEGGLGKGADIATASRCNIRRSQDSCCIIASCSFLSLSKWICLGFDWICKINNIFYIYLFYMFFSLT